MTPSPAKPASIIAQVEASGTAATSDASFTVRVNGDRLMVSPLRSKNENRVLTLLPRVYVPLCVMLGNPGTELPLLAVNSNCNSSPGMLLYAYTIKLALALEVR